jgi:hypothetical protein
LGKGTNERFSTRAFLAYLYNDKLGGLDPLRNYYIQTGELPESFEDSVNRKEL